MSLPYFLFLNCKWPKTYTMSFMPVNETEIKLKLKLIKTKNG